MAIEGLKKSLDFSIFKFLHIFLAIIAHKKTASKDSYNVNLHQLSERHKIRELWVFQKHEGTSSSHERTGKESTVRKAFFFQFQKT